MSCRNTEVAMARTIWTGSLSFGLVNIPVGIYTATRDRSVHFNQFERGTSDRIRYKKVNERTGEEVEASRIDRGVDVGGGEYVILSDDELDAAAPERSRTVEITSFVDLNDIDPIYYRTSYYLAPQGDGGGKAYALLLKAMRESSRVGIATFVMRGKEYLVAVRPEDGVLALETMYFADEVKDPGEELPDLQGGAELTTREIDTAKLLIESMAADWSPEEYHDTYRERLEELIEQKRQGREIVTESPVRRSTNVVDLMEALQASVAAAQSERAQARDEPVSDRAAGRPKRPAPTDKASPPGGRPTRKRPPTKPAAKAGQAAKKAPVAKTSRQRKAS
jgi:DNA end-binding protein Ku